jgi:hypothetical protein
VPELSRFLGIVIRIQRAALGLPLVPIEPLE